MNIHDLKCWPEYFEAVQNETKRFEYRRNDRNFQCGDLLQLREWNPKTMQYTGRTQLVDTPYIMYGTYSIGEQVVVPPGWALMSIRKVKLGVTPLR